MQLASPLTDAANVNETRTHAHKRPCTADTFRGLASAMRNCSTALISLAVGNVFVNALEVRGSGGGEWGMKIWGGLGSV